MTKKQYIKRMKQHENSFDKLWSKIVTDTNLFIDQNPDIGIYSLPTVEHFTDYMCLSGSWMTDRINGKSGVTSAPNYKGSLTKKIRKALGYTF